MRATAVSSNTKWVSSRGAPAPYGVISHRSVPFLSLYTKNAHDIKFILHAKVCNTYTLFKVRSHDRFPGAIYMCVIFFHIICLYD